MGKYRVLLPRFLACADAGSVWCGGAAVVVGGDGDGQVVHVRLFFPSHADAPCV